MLSSLLTLTTLAVGTLAYVHHVQVGGLKPDGTPNLAYWPNNFPAAVGDKVVFTFHVKNHTVTQSSFDEPCAKLKDSYGNIIGFDSGFQPVAATDTNFPTFELTVHDEKPIWGYCRQLNPPSTHCQSGMVFGINPPPSGNTFDAFLQKAKKSTAQNSLLPPTSTTTSSASWSSPTDWNAYTPQTHKVTVGGDPKTVGFVYNPSNITANVGDVVEFVFMQKNHTVTQASFDQPCRPIADTTYPSVYGFDSGFMPVSPNQTDNFPTFSIEVKDTKPIWAYCRQQAAAFSHCGVGMVFSVNADANSDKSFAAFQQLAVWQNGTGVVQPLGPPASPSSAPNPSSKNAALLNVNDDADSQDWDARALKRLSIFAPVAVGMLGIVLVLLCAVLVVGFKLLGRSNRQGEILPTRNVSQSYQQVPVKMPSSKMQSDGTHDYDEPFVAPSGRYSS